jgi:lycopene beta-cyclase
VGRFEYLALMGLCLAVTLPLEFAFDARVWRRPRRLAVALVPAFLAFVGWDLWATSSGTWGFDPDATVGVTLPGGMPVEELVFFVVVPVCALLTLESVRNVLAGRIAWIPRPGGRR